jgi:hypothetical protein
MTPPDSYFSNPDFQAMEALFHDYIAQGEGRNIGWLAAKSGLPITVCQKGYVQGFWPQRIHSIAREASVAARNKVVGNVAGLNIRDVGDYTDLADAAKKQLLLMIEAGTVPPAVLTKIFFEATMGRRKALGIGEGDPGLDQMKKLLEDSLKPEEPFKLDLTKLEAPLDLPAMPGQLSDEEPTDENGETGDRGEPA